MKRKTLICSVVLVLAFAGMLQAGIGFGIRPLLLIGKTLNAPTLEEMDYAHLFDRPPDWKTLSYGVSVQFMFKTGAFRFGLDVGIQSLYISEVSAVADSSEKAVEAAGHTLGVIEFNPLRLLIFQVGFGAYGIRWAFISEGGGVDLEDDSGIVLHPGVMLAGGINIPLGRHLSVPIMARADLIFVEGGIRAPITLAFGFSFNL